MTVDTSHLVKEIKELRTFIAGSPYTLEEAEAAAAKIYDAMQDIEANAEWLRSDEGKAAMEMIKTSNAHHQIDSYQRTLGLSLMRIETRYVVTNTKELESPAGFHPDTRVFVQTQIAIHTDSLDRLPNSNETLYAHEMKVGL